MIALESEVASLYVRKMDIDRVIQQTKAETLTIKPGTKYLVVLLYNPWKKNLTLTLNYIIHHIIDTILILGNQEQ